MAAEDRIHAVVDPIIEEMELELVDLVYAGGRLKITIDRADGLDTEMLTKTARMINHEMDMQDPIKGAYTLEVSSPGVERPLRTPAHYARSIGEQVAIKLRPNQENLRRLKGELTAANDDTITVTNDDGVHSVSFDQIAKANTVFDWGPGPKPGKAKNNNTAITSNTNKSATTSNTNKSAHGGSSNESRKGSES
jgi:ribosome maturation factor RimP